MHKLRLAMLALLALLMPASIIAMTAAPAQAVNARMEVLTANIGGANVYGAGLYSDGSAPGGTLLRMMQDRPYLDAVAVQEICKGQGQWLANYTGWTYDFTPMTHAHENTGTQACAGDEKGQAVLTQPSRTTKVGVHTKELGDVNYGKEFRAICVDVKQSWTFNTETLRVCSAHLWADGINATTGEPYDQAFNQAKRAEQMGVLSAWLDTTATNASEYKTVLGIDANSQPKTPAIDHIHRVKRDGTINSTNKFWEVDQSFTGAASPDCVGDATTVCRAGRPTSGSIKIDYLFASQDGMDKHEGGLSASRVNQGNAVGGSNVAPHAYALHGVLNWTNVH